MPTFVPKETPRPKKTQETSAKADQKDTKHKESKNVHTFAVRVPRFVLDPKANTVHTSPPITVDVNSPHISSAASLKLLELSELQNDPIVSRILGRDHQLNPTCSPTDTSHGNSVVCKGRKSPQLYRTRTSIARGSPSIGFSIPSPHLQRPGLQKLCHKKTSVPSPGSNFIAKGCEMYKSLARCEEIEIDQNTRRAEPGESSVDIDKAIQIRIGNLLRGISDSGHSTDQQSSISTAIPNARGHHRFPKLDAKGKRTVQILLGKSRSKILKGNSGSQSATSPEISQALNTTNTIDEQSPNAEAIARYSED